MSGEATQQMARRRDAAADVAAAAAAVIIVVVVVMSEREAAGVEFTVRCGDTMMYNVATRDAGEMTKARDRETTAALCLLHACARGAWGWGGGGGGGAAAEARRLEPTSPTAARRARRHDP